MKKEKNLKLDDIISTQDILDALIYGLQQENEILRKKLNNKQLTEEEIIFYTYVFSMIKRGLK